jgi:hypothetical protein
MAKATRKQLLGRAFENFQEKAVGLATGAKVSYEEWEEARALILSYPELLRALPPWVSSCRYGSMYWQFIKQTAETYAERRQFIWSSLAPVLDLIEAGADQPVAITLEALLRSCTSQAVTDTWLRIQARRETDPEGAITAGRSLLEATCKYVLDSRKVDYSAAEDLPKLYGKAANAMNLGPQSHKEEVFKQILSGCVSVANGLAALRNAFGDAHGRAASQPKPSQRHADLAVNLAGALAAFLIATYEERYKESGKGAT